MKKIISIVCLLVLSLASFAQPLGGKNSSVEVLGGMKVDSGFVIPPFASFKNKGLDTTGRIFRATSDSLPRYMKNGVSKKIITKFDSGTVYVDAGEVGQANGVASLNSFGIVPSAQLPSITISGQVYVDTNQAEMLSHVSATAGALSIRTDSSSALFVLTNTPSSVRANWHITQGNGVSAYNGRTGAITPRRGDYVTDSVAEGSGNLYYTSSRVQGVIAGDTTAGWLVSGARLIDSTTALRSAISGGLGLDQVLSISPNSNRSLHLGRKTGSHTYQQAALGISSSDSSGYFIVQDTTNTAYITGGASLGNTNFGIAGNASSAISLSAQIGSVYISILDGGLSARLDETSLSFGAGANSFSTTGGILANQLRGNGSTPSLTLGAGAGSGASSVISGTDMGGYITINSGGTPPSNATIATINFVVPFGSAPRCVVLSPANQTAATLTGTRMIYVSQGLITATGFVILSNAIGINASAQHQWFYTVIQ